MTRLKKTLAAVATAVLGLTGAIALESPAAAFSGGCAWPRVCFYKTYSDVNNDKPTAAYQDITSGWQTLGSKSKGSYWVYNSRRDDGAKLHFTNGKTVCIEPLNGTVLRAADGGWGTVDKIRIYSTYNCK